MLKERRRHERHTINRVAKVQSAGSLPRDCLVTDISEGGARLYAEGIVVPDQFVLLLTGSRAMRHECRVGWRVGNGIGGEVARLSPPAANLSPGGPQQPPGSADSARQATGR